MRISHPCSTCGTDLGRLRARRDAHYALPLVFCPRCGVAAIRRATGPRARRRRRLAVALVALVLQTAAALVFVLSARALCIDFGDRLITRADAVPAALAAAFVVAVATGTWLAATLPHWRSLAAWSAFAGIVVGLLSIDTLVAPFVRGWLDAAGLPVTVGAVRWDRWIARVVVLLGYLATTLAGVPVGSAARRIEARARRDWVAGVARRRKAERALG